VPSEMEELFGKDGFRSGHVTLEACCLNSHLVCPLTLCSCIKCG
jgi:hypothetical protein